jgi:hypothetical protein
MKRTPCLVTVRRVSTGADYSARLFLRNPSADAFDSMSRLVRLADGISREYLRLVSVESLQIPDGAVRQQATAEREARDNGRAFSLWSPGYGADKLYSFLSARVDSLLASMPR